MKQLVVHAAALEDLDHWQRTDTKLLSKTMRLVVECCRTPFTGTGKPEPLKGDYSGYWSRRINQEHRLIYAVTDTEVIVISARYHYER